MRRATDGSYLPPDLPCRPPDGDLFPPSLFVVSFLALARINSLLLSLLWEISLYCFKPCIASPLCVCFDLLGFGYRHLPLL